MPTISQQTSNVYISECPLGAGDESTEFGHTAVVIPPGVLNSGDLTAVQKLLYGRMVALAAPQYFRQAFCSVEDLAVHLGVDRDVTKAALAGLIRRRLIIRVPATTALYRIPDTPMSRMKGFFLRVSR